VLEFILFLVQNGKPPGNGSSELVVDCASSRGRSEVSVRLLLLLLHLILRWSDCKASGFSFAFGGAAAQVKLSLVYRHRLGRSSGLQ